MRAEDLMVGDRVLYEGQSYQIAEIGGMVCLDADEELFACLEDIEPIPLTPEILEKNRFKSWEHGHIFKERIGICGQTISASSPIEVIVYEGGHSIIMNPHEGKAFQGSIDSVHELQHALRLCGIDKEIEL